MILILVCLAGLDEMIPIPAETGSRIWKCHGTNDELKLFYTESFDWANLRYQSPRSWWFVKLPLFRRLCWWRRAKIFKIKF